MIFPRDLWWPVHHQGPFWGQLLRHVPYYRRWQCSAAGTPSRLHTVTGPVAGPSKARSRVAVSMGRVPAAAWKLFRPRAVSHTISSGRGRPDAAIRR